VADRPWSAHPFGFGSGFATDCDAFNNPYFYVLADPANFCATGDFVDADGANTAANEQPHIPQIAAPLNATAAEGALMTPIEVTATDPDASRTLTITQSGCRRISRSPRTPPVPVLATPRFPDAWIRRRECPTRRTGVLPHRLHGLGWH